MVKRNKFKSNKHRFESWEKHAHDEHDEINPRSNEELHFSVWVRIDRRNERWDLTATRNALHYFIKILRLFKYFEVKTLCYSKTSMIKTIPLVSISFFLYSLCFLRTFLGVCGKMEKVFRLWVHLSLSAFHT
jgi:hypothetical protein